MERTKQESNTKENKTFTQITKGIVISFISTIILLIIFSTLLTYTNLNENCISPVIIVITGISILIGSSISSRKIKKNGLFNGAIIGTSYILIIYILSSAISMNFVITLETLLLIIASIICGIIGRNNRSKFAYIKFYDNRLKKFMKNIK